MISAQVNAIVTHSFLLLLAVHSFANATSDNSNSQAPMLLPPRQLTRRHTSPPAKDFPPKLIHQPQSVQLEPMEPHTIECPVESRPESKIKWFKDNQLLASEPTHLEQTGSELMFFSVNDADTGDYHCEATNYLGSITSDRFRLTVNPANNNNNDNMNQQGNTKIKLELTQNMAALKSGYAEFACKVSTDPSQPREWRPQIGWRRNGRLLKPAELTDGAQLDADDKSEAQGRAYRLQELSALSVMLRVQNDDSANFTCLLLEPNTREILAESNSLRSSVSVATPADNGGSFGADSNQLATNQVIMDVNLGPPIDNLTNQTTKLINANNDNSRPGIGALSPARSLAELVLQLYELAKPALVLLGIFSLVGCIVGLQLLVLRRRGRGNRYIKHQYAGSCGSSNGGGGSSSGGSGTSSAIAGSLEVCDPILSSLLQRTLSAPNANSLAGKKAFRGARDHMRHKVADSASNQQDLIDGFFQDQHQQQPFRFQAMPNLYNQSLAAREQARSLLQASEHMRSLSNLHKQTHNQSHLTRPFGNQLQSQQQGSHLNLPLSFNFEQQANRLLDGPAQLMSSGGFWPGHQAARQQQGDEHYQLVNCNSSSNTSSSSAAAPGEPRPISGNPLRQRRANDAPLDHYSTIDVTSEDDENRYEELDRAEESGRPVRCTSSFVSASQVRSSFTSNSSSSGRGTSSSAGKEQPAAKQQQQQQQHERRQQYPDQLSPYAVSSICQTNQPQQPTINAEEAMRALNEQFDINELMLLDDVEKASGAHLRNQLPFNQLPPPPPPSS